MARQSEQQRRHGGGLASGARQDGTAVAARSRAGYTEGRKKAVDLLRRVGRRKAERSEAVPTGMGQVVVPVTGHDVDVQVIRLAGVIARRQGSQVTLVHVVEVPRSLPIDTDYRPEESQQVLDHAVHEAEILGFKPASELIQSRDAGSALVAEAQALNADLILLGLPRLVTSGQPTLGKTVPHVLLHAHCRVVVVRP